MWDTTWWWTTTTTLLFPPHLFIPIHRWRRPRHRYLLHRPRPWFLRFTSRIPNFRFSPMFVPSSLLIKCLISFILTAMFVCIVIFIDCFKRFFIFIVFVDSEVLGISFVSCFFSFVSGLRRWLIRKERVRFWIVAFRSDNALGFVIFYSLNFKRHFTIFFPFSQKMHSILSIRFTCYKTKRCPKTR